jgi:hypothetical protein
MNGVSKKKKGLKRRDKELWKRKSIQPNHARDILGDFGLSLGALRVQMKNLE